MKSWIDQLEPIILEFRNGDEHPLSLAEVERLCEIIQAKVNLYEGNITEDNYNKILG